jgi:uncharacterized membrane protein
MRDKFAKGRSWRRLILPASLILNLFLLAVVIGHALRQDTPVAPTLAGALTNAEASLSPADAAAFADVMRRAAPKYALAAQQLGEARRNVGQKITADPYNADDVRSALQAWRSASSRFFDSFNAALVEALSKVSVEGRHNLIAQRRAHRSTFTPLQW